MSDMLISLKPKYAELIYRGEKNVELRKVFPKQLNIGDKVYIYESSPKRKITGYFIVDFIENICPSIVWTNKKYKLGTGSSDFWGYVGDYKELYVIGIDSYRKYPVNEELSYAYLNEAYGNFNPPQSYVYLSGRYDWEEPLKRGSF